MDANAKRLKHEADMRRQEEEDIEAGVFPAPTAKNFPSDHAVAALTDARRWRHV